jgi:serine/threonine protein kinase
MAQRVEIPGFEFGELIGHGGMGSVYRARQVDLDRDVAIKVIHPHLAEDPDFQSRFETEMKMASAIDHPNVVSVFEAGEAGGELFISMALVPGENLSETLRREGRLDPARASSIVSQIASALDAAHEKGIVHRDVKPANVLLDRRVDHAYLTDFGIAKSLEATQAHTATGQAVGAVRYISPEQAKNERVDKRADVYSLGCVLYEALTGELIFGEGSDASILLAKVNGEVEPPTHSVAGLNPSFDAVIEKALALNPDDRFQSAGELAAAASAATRGEDLTHILPRAATGGDKTRYIRGFSAGEDATMIQRASKGWRKPWMTPVAVLALALIAAGVGYGLSQMGGQDEEPVVTSDESSQSIVTEPPEAVAEPPSSIADVQASPDEPEPASGVLSLTPVTATGFVARVPSEWYWKTRNDPVSEIRTMNVWEDPVEPLIDIQVDNQAAEGVSPLDSALSVRSDNSSGIDGYSEVSIESTSLAGRPAAQWIFDAVEDGQTIRKIDIFFTSCDSDFAVIGAAPKAQFADYRQTFKAVATSIDAC